MINPSKRTKVPIPTRCLFTPADVGLNVQLLSLEQPNLLEFGLWPSLPLCQQPVESWHELHTGADDDDGDDGDLW